MGNWIKWLGRKELWQKGKAYLKENGAKKTIGRFSALLQEKIWEKYFLGVENEERYKKWWKSQIITEKDKKKIQKKIEKFKYKPIISVLVPVYNTPPRYLEACFRSVEEQAYPYWELCVADDCSTDPATRKIVSLYEKKAEYDSRVKITRHKKNQHISLATNSALKLARGEFAALLDHDDTLHSAALYLVAKTLNQNSGLDFIYSDEDKINDKEEHSEPHFKPDWNPDLLLSMNYICHLAVIRRSVMEKIGGMRKGFEGAQDYDLFLRLSEKTQKIAHIPHVLYHWHKIHGSTSMSHSNKGYADINAKKSLFSAGKRRKEDWKVEKGLAPTSYRVKRKLGRNSKVAIIIPFRDRVELLKKCVNSIVEKTYYRDYEIVLVDNGSHEPETLEYLKTLQANVGSGYGSSLRLEPTKYLAEAGHIPKIKILNYPLSFNFAAINNFAAKKVEEPYILFLNNDIEIINPGWLSAMMEHIPRPEVGAVGAKLFYPNGRIQHAGVVLGMGKYKNKPCGVAGHSHKYFLKRSHGYFEQINVIRDYSAVTAACMLAKRDLFLELGGFDEKNFAVAWNDIDYCLRLREKGYLIVYTPYARLYHFESISRGSDEKGKARERFHQETDKMYEKWGDKLANDPYYNPNLSLEDESFRIREKAPQLI